MGARESIYLEGFAHRNPVPVASRIGPFVHSGVLTGRDPRSLTMPDTLEEQMANVFERIRELMDAVGGSIGDIAKLTFWLADYRDRDALNREWEAMFPSPADRPARQAMAAMLDGGSKVQCDVVAILNDGRI